ncbi:IS240-type transposase (ISH102) [Halococcus salifodinae DSM 8989]|uniref:IS240-type transposase (ISH102) n=1 Tax=Halococcus salifodinae DSM 8989 TaxID=1227456 RepID=M0MZ10_9EURY|nr:IS240-type transposase (ISH102) [Halococcus salifodinae DSM 8989]
MHLAGLSLLNTISILDVFGVSRARSTINNWVHEAELQPESGKTPDYVAVDETAIRLDDERYWLYAAVDPESYELLHTKLETTINNALAHGFSAELRQKHHVDDATFLVDGATPLHEACRRRHGLDFRDEQHGNRNAVERVFREGKRRSPRSRTVSATPIQQLPTSGCDRSPSHGICVSEHYAPDEEKRFTRRDRTSAVQWWPHSR